jgi:hypothetical protein
MQTIDQNLGGGGGGGGGGGNVYGAFIDTNRVITSGSYSSSYSYTATEDCYLFFTFGGTTSSSGKLYLDGNLIRYIFVNTSDNNYGDGIYLKKGQTAEVQSPQAGTFQYIVYGLTQGTESIFTPIIYSETERVVGIWRDNKPLYQRTWTGLNVTPAYNSWTNVIPNDVDIETLVNWEALSNADYKNLNGTGIEWQVYGGYVRAEYNQNVNVRTIEVLTLQYTKTTDVAGSGNWNTDGVPTHHYSTSEQVIGKWVNGKPLYEISISIAGVSIPTNGTVTVYTDSVINLRHAEGCATDNNIEYCVPETGIRIRQIGGDVQMVAVNGASWVISDGYLTIQYTKSTD